MKRNIGIYAKAVYVSTSFLQHKPVLRPQIRASNASITCFYVFALHTG